MLDWINKDIYPSSTSILCFWCKHSFSTKPIGCPIKFINNRIEKSYISQITKDKYYMKENITKTKLEQLSQLKQDTIEIKLIEKEHYVTDGIFCSFNCVMSFIQENAHDSFIVKVKCYYIVCIKNVLEVMLKK